MIAVRLIGLQHGDWDEVKEVIGSGNLCLVEHEPKYDKPEGNAYKVSYTGKLIGYIPIVATLRGFYKDATSVEERQRMTEWGEATARVRKWLDSRLKYQGETSWSAPVADVLYNKNGEWNFKDGEPRQISIMFMDV